jgi:integrase/recombinase XerD
MEPDLRELLASWRRHLEAEHKSPHTLKTYTDGVTYFLAWCEAEGRPAVLGEDTVVDWVRSLYQSGKTPATAVSRQAAVRRFSKWLARKGYIESDRLRDLERPKLDEPAVLPLTDDQLRALLATCKGKEFHHVRDRAVIMLMFETGLRAAELTGMTTDDVNLDARLAVIRRGKGGRGRLVRFSPQCNAALDDYAHLRRRHQRVTSGAFWLGADGREFGYWGLYHAIRRRGVTAGMPDLHPHQLRSTSAVRWLKKGGSATGLMAQAGWASVDMLRRYIRAAESELAAEEADRLGLGDI